MSDGTGRDGDMARRVAMIGGAVLLMVTGVALLGPDVAPPHEPFPDSAAATLSAPETPIPAEAGVFRLAPGDLAATPDAERRPEAHPRTMRMYRALRAYPGAPPRIPHGLTRQEFRGGRCNACHGRGGYVARFAAYAPVTPHPEMSDCLQCHVPDDALVGRDFPEGTSGPDVCLQCHVLDRATPLYVALDWSAPSWPATGTPPMPGAPPSVPHGFQLRENCLACHVGAGAMEEIRTDHGERANCRQCHAAAMEPVEEFTRPAVASRRVGGGER